MYRLEEEKETVEGETVTVYGIAWETGRIRNITVDRERMRAFVMECERCGECPTLPVWQGLNRVINEYLDGITLQDILDQQRERYTNDYII